MPMVNPGAKPYKVGTQQAAMEKFAAGPQPTMAQKAAASINAARTATAKAADNVAKAAMHSIKAIKTSTGGAVANVKAVHIHAFNPPEASGVGDQLGHLSRVYGKAATAGLVAKASTGILAGQAALAGARNPEAAKTRLANLKEDQAVKDGGGAIWSGGPKTDNPRARS